MANKCDIGLATGAILGVVVFYNSASIFAPVAGIFGVIALFLLLYRVLTDDE